MLFSILQLFIYECDTLKGQNLTMNYPVYNVTINLQPNKGYSLFCNFKSLCEGKRVTPLKIRT